MGPIMTNAKQKRVRPATHREDPLLSLAQAGKQLGKDGQTIGRWIKQGLMQCVRLPNGLHCVRQSQIDKILELTQIDPGADHTE